MKGFFNFMRNPKLVHILVMVILTFTKNVPANLHECE